MTLIILLHKFHLIALKKRLNIYTSNKAQEIYITTFKLSLQGRNSISRYSNSTVITLKKDNRQKILDSLIINLYGNINIELI